jgi:hypothetical protein
VSALFNKYADDNIAAKILCSLAEIAGFNIYDTSEIGCVMEGLSV